MGHDQDCAAMGATAPEHEKLRPLVGTFRARVSMWMGGPDPMVSTGVMTNTLELGGRYLHQSYKGDPGPGPFPNFEGRGYWGYNTLDKRYEGFWIDTASTFMQTEQGQVDAGGKVWTMMGQMTNPQGGGTIRKKSIITLIDNNRHTLEMHFETPGGWMKAMAIEYTRAR